MSSCGCASTDYNHELVRLGKNLT